jgi:hypothetical protein
MTYIHGLHLHVKVIVHIPVTKIPSHKYYMEFDGLFLSMGKSFP